MCMAIPGRVTEVSRGKAMVDYGAIKKMANTDVVIPKKGDWVLVFSNQVMETVPEKRAKEILKAFGGKK